MTAEHQSTSTNSAAMNTVNRNNSSQNLEVECVSSGVMVGERLSEDPITEEIRIETGSSTSSRDSDDEDNCQEIVAPEECADSFGNIVVKSSSDVHFGNNTYYRYRGPVTIKQFVYEDESADRNFAIENGEKSNVDLQPETVIQSDTVIHTNEELKKGDNNHDVPNAVSKKNENKTKSVKGPHWLNIVYKKRKLISVSILTALIISLILLIILLINKKHKVFLPQWFQESNLNGELKIIPREDWLAESPKDHIDLLVTPIPNVIILCTSTANCTNRGKCTELVQYVQRYHMNTFNWADVAYNFLVGGDGYIYEGRGWYGKGSHSHIWNSKSIGIGFIGNFEDENAPKQQISAAKKLIEKGVKDGYLATDYKLLAHLQISVTISPGKFLYEDMKTWPHWSNESSPHPI